MPRNTHRQYFNNYVSMADEDNLAQEKLNELKNCFSSFDRNGDGTISASEFQNALIRMNIYISGDEVKSIIEEYDVDGNDSLDFTEFLMLTAKLDPRIGQEIEINKAFKLFDKDNDGYITRSEAVDALKRFGVTTSRDEVDTLFSMTDDNSDNLISHTEFNNILYDAVPPATVMSTFDMVSKGRRSPRPSRVSRSQTDFSRSPARSLSGESSPKSPRSPK